MIPEYQFKVDEAAEDLCDRIAMRMVRRFAFTLDEAINRINRHWQGHDFLPYPKDVDVQAAELHEDNKDERVRCYTDSDEVEPHEDASEKDSEIDIRYHEFSGYWANGITYGADSYWWLNPPGLKPLPYPDLHPQDAYPDKCARATLAESCPDLPPPQGGACATTPEYQFKVDDVAEEFCDSIAVKMLRLFGFSLEEAIGRINRRWSGQDFAPHVVDGELDVRFKSDREFWAKDITYGPETRWWDNPPNLKPLPYP